MAFPYVSIELDYEMIAICLMTFLEEPAVIFF